MRQAPPLWKQLRSHVWSYVTLLDLIAEALQMESQMHKNICRMKRNIFQYASSSTAPGSGGSFKELKL